MLRWMSLALLLPSIALAQNCDDPASQNEMNNCAHSAWEEADRDLNAAYKQARAAMRQIDSDLPSDLAGGEIALRDAQRAWITFRDAACAAEGFLFRGGSMEPMMVASCMAALTRQRTQDLRNLAEYQ